MLQLSALTARKKKRKKIFTVGISDAKNVTTKKHTYDQKN